MKTFEIKGLSFRYAGEEKYAIEDINLDIDYGEFIVICGESGSGKTSFLRHLKPTLAPSGEKKGEILFYGQNIKELSFRDSTERIGYVLQNPDNQIVTDKVWHELAFGLESLSMDTRSIRLRVAEMASFFGIQDWFTRDVSTLSGGQKQLLNLASIMSMNPATLILDEPTSQLDPIAAGDFLDTIRKINRELGTTIIMTEQNLEEVFPMADRAIVMDKGKVIANDKPLDVGRFLKESKHNMLESMPTPLQVGDALTVRDGRRWLIERLRGKSIIKDEITLKPESDKDGTLALRMKEVWFKYDKEEVLKSLDLSVEKAKLTCLVGGNGSGKSTALSLLMGINKARRGKVDIFGGRVAMLPQNVQSLFVESTVKNDLETITSTKLDEVVKLMKLENFLDRHPYDLSAGEQERLGLAKVLLVDPDIFLLDEPTKGMDNNFKKKLADIFRQLKRQGKTIVMVSHDLEFCAREADSCKLFFDGNIVSSNKPNAFFSDNMFYTTSANRMSRQIFKNAVTADDIVTLCEYNLLNCQGEGDYED